jgi:hypothetical protein
VAMVSQWGAALGVAGFGVPRRASHHATFASLHMVSSSPAIGKVKLGRCLWPLHRSGPGREQSEERDEATEWPPNGHRISPE